MGYRMMWESHPDREAALLCLERGPGLARRGGKWVHREPRSASTAASSSSAPSRLEASARTRANSASPTPRAVSS